jgi:hypothetical protein
MARNLVRILPADIERITKSSPVNNRARAVMSESLEPNRQVPEATDV